MRLTLQQGADKKAINPKINLRTLWNRTTIKAAEKYSSWLEM